MMRRSLRGIPKGKVGPAVAARPVSDVKIGQVGWVSRAFVICRRSVAAPWSNLDEGTAWALSDRAIDMARCQISAAWIAAEGVTPRMRVERADYLSAYACQRRLVQRSAWSWKLRSDAQCPSPRGSHR